MFLNTCATIFRGSAQMLEEILKHTEHKTKLESGRDVLKRSEGLSENWRTVETTVVRVFWQKFLRLHEFSIRLDAICQELRDN